MAAPPLADSTYVVEELQPSRKETVAGNRSAVAQTEEERDAEGYLRVVAAASCSEKEEEEDR